ncbi:MAG TPA: DinB family protein [Thermoanaerobaculia bacterium]|jgi:hypothetical protein|nr:DinB family protein [Thermoanaerobaculia bacterium]
MKIERPMSGEYHPAFERYVARVSEADALGALERQAAEIRAVLAPLTPERAGFRYAPGKWTVREVLGHVTDTERVFGYRAMCVARGETASLPGFEENDYAANAGHDRYAIADLIAEFEAGRGSNISMLAHLDDAALRRIGTANGSPISVRAIAYVMVGHARHHLGVLASRYGVTVGA